MRGDVSLAEKTQKGPKTTQSLVASIVCTRPPPTSTQRGALASRPTQAAPQGLAGSPVPQTLEYVEKNSSELPIIFCPSSAPANPANFHFTCLTEVFLTGVHKSPDPSSLQHTCPQNECRPWLVHRLTRPSPPGEARAPLS